MVNRHTFSKRVLLAARPLACLLILGAIAGEACAEARPNLVFILTDDQRRDQLGCYGNEVIRTPHIDRLAAEGVLFENAFVTSAICTPSRACYFLGQYERRHGINFNSGTSMSAAAWSKSFPVLLREAGYFTGYVGKNHVPVGARGYDTGLLEASFDYWYAGHGHLGFYPKEKHDLFVSAESDTQVEVIAEGAEAFVDSGMSFLEGATSFVDRRPADQPFLMMVALNVPHGSGTDTMRQRPADGELYTTAYRDMPEAIRPPASYTPRDQIGSPKLPAEVGRVERRQKGYDYVDRPDTLREKMIRQHQTVTGIDRFVGRLRDVLERTGVAGNTVIVVASDHGLMLGEHGLGGKALNYEPCLAIPMIVYDPRLPDTQRGRRDDSLVMSIDIAPTLLELGGVTPPAEVQGESLAPIIRGEASSDREYVFAENLWSTIFGNPRCESVRGKRWKYIRYFENDPSIYDGLAKKDIYLTNAINTNSYRKWLTASIKGEEPVYEELFDLVNDPNETTNLASMPQHAERLRQMGELCQDLVAEAKGLLNEPPATVALPYGKRSSGVTKRE